jgi:glycine/D-amino acid oxidase-like deaminating enzyme/nitrite reductase/ring-hydroxylating ferredoxin subunit
VIGAGITGLTAAFFIARSGRSVAVLERDTIAGGETGRTTGFLTEVLDARLVDLAAIHGKRSAQSAWASSRKGMELVASIARELSIDCDYRRLDAYLYGPRASDRVLLRREADLAFEFGRPVEMVEPGTIPFPCKAVLRIPDQARLNPRKYMLALARGIVSHGGAIYENTDVRRLDRNKNSRRGAVRAGDPGASVTADAVLLASNAPFVDRRPMYSRLRPYRSYVIAGRVPHGRVPEGLFWDTLDPYDYARLDPGPRDDLLILGGADHWVGQPGRPEASEAKVIAYWKKVLGSSPLDPVRWSGQILNSEDGLPFIGRNPRSSTGEGIATGFGGNGLTLGTLAGWMFSEKLQGRPTEWDKLYDPGRKAAPTVGTPLHKDAPAPPRGKTPMVRSLSTLRVGQGAWYPYRGHRVAVYRGFDRSIRATDPTCTHLGCRVEWNRLERSWDCPCHGSRFDVDGKVLDGPAFRPLAVIDLVEQDNAPPRPQQRDVSKRKRTTHPK